jgi:hypothetical protein
MLLACHTLHEFEEEGMHLLAETCNWYTRLYASIVRGYGKDTGLSNLRIDHPH